MSPELVHIYLDHSPQVGLSQSYYFDIRDCDNNRILNGGIIYHHDRYSHESENFNGPSLILGSYSTHT